MHTLVSGQYARCCRGIAGNKHAQDSVADVANIDAWTMDHAYMLVRHRLQEGSCQSLHHLLYSRSHSRNMFDGRRPRSRKVALGGQSKAKAESR